MLLGKEMRIIDTPSTRTRSLTILDNTTYTFDQKEHHLLWKKANGEDSNPYRLYGLGNGGGLLDETFGENGVHGVDVDGANILLDGKRTDDPSALHAISVSRNNVKFWTNNYVGYLQKGDQYIRIASRFSRLDFRSTEPDYFVRYMAASLDDSHKNAACKELMPACGEATPELRGTLLDCAMLWERHLATLLESFHHTNNAKEENTQTLFIDKEGKGCVSIYPDFVSKSEPRIIADAKYKHIDKDLNDQNDRDDFYQMLAYMLRFDAHTGFLLYPIPKGYKGENPVEYELATGVDFEGASHGRRSDNKIRLVKAGLEVPAQVGCEDYQEFEDKMRASEERFRGLLHELGVQGSSVS